MRGGDPRPAPNVALSLSRMRANDRSDEVEQPDEPPLITPRSGTPLILEPVDNRRRSGNQSLCPDQLCAHEHEQTPPRYQLDNSYVDPDQHRKVAPRHKAQSLLSDSIISAI